MTELVQFLCDLSERLRDENKNLTPDSILLQNVVGLIGGQQSRIAELEKQAAVVDRMHAQALRAEWQQRRIAAALESAVLYGWGYQCRPGRRPAVG